MGLLEIAGAVGIVVGIIAGIAQVLDYLEKRKEKKHARAALKEPDQILDPQLQTLQSYKRQDWGETVDVSVFYGRQVELVELERWIITDHCRLIAILGMGGIGKTALSVKLAEQIKDQFEYLFRRDLKNAPRVEDILGDCIKFLSDQKKTDLPEDLHGRISLVIEYFQQRRCLLILDNAETILKGGDRAGHYREGYEGYGELLQRVGEGIHQSCLLLTSREKPKEVALLEGRTLPVRSFPLSGVKKEAGGKILATKGLAGSADEYGALTDRYQGNPLALKIIPTTILDIFAGDIAKFLEQGATVFGDIRDVLDQQFDRLSNLEKEIMFWLTINREPVLLQELKDDFVIPAPQSKLIEAIESLGRRSLIEKSTATFTQQPVVMEYVTDRIIEQIYEELTTEKISLFNSYALIKATSKDYVRNSQIQLILKPIADRLLTNYGKKGVENKLKSILSMWRERTPQMPGYAGGNTINILVYLKSDLSTYDFSTLAVWQAHLHGTSLCDVNFARSNIIKSVFNDIFGKVYSITFSPDGKFLATTGSKAEVRLWHVIDGNQIAIFRGCTDWVNTARFDFRNKIIACGNLDGTIKLWDFQTEKCIKILHGHTHRVLSVAFNQNGEILASGSRDKTVRLWNIKSGKCLSTLKGHLKSISSVTFDPIGQILASCSDDATIKLWDIQTGTCIKTLEGHKKEIWSIGFSQDGKIIASGSDDHSIKLWNVETGLCFMTLMGHQKEIWSVIFSPDGTILASGSEDNMIKLWNIKTGQCIKTLTEHKSWINTIAFSPVGSILASASYDNTVKLWDIMAGLCIKTLQGYRNAVSCIKFCNGGKKLLSFSTDQILRSWDIDITSCNKIMEGFADLVGKTAINQDGTMMASIMYNKVIKLWNIEKKQNIKILKGHESWIWSIDFNKNNDMLASGGYDKTVRLWDICSGNCIKILRGHSGGISPVIFNQKGNIVVSGSDDKTIRIWDIIGGNCLKILEGHLSGITSITISTDDCLLASSSYDGAIKLWEISTGNCLGTMLVQIDIISEIAFIPNTQKIICCGTDGSVIVLDVLTGQSIKSFKGHSNAVWSVAFSPDAKILATSSEDGTIKLWNIETGECLKTMRSDRPYEHMNITGVKGLSEAQKATLKALGAVDNSEEMS